MTRCPPDHASTVTLACHAKVNLALAVGAPDATGYHPIASWMIAVTFGDTLTLRRAGGDASGDASRYDIRFADDAPRVERIDWPLEKDLAVRAHRALEAEVGRALPIELTLAKRVPTGAGLGGGSSDAAAVLVGVDRLYELGLSERELRAHGAALGSDVPFLVAALHGQHSAVATGYGDQLAPAPLDEPIDLVLVLGPWSCATGPVYAAFDRKGGCADVDSDRVARLAQGPPRDDALFNDLADAACEVCPPLDEARRRVAAVTGRRAHVTGSGSAMFVLAQGPDDARALATRIAAIDDLAAVPTRTLPAPA